MDHDFLGALIAIGLVFGLILALVVWGALRVILFWHHPSEW
jgi:hypothetical protein